MSLSLIIARRLYGSNDNSRQVSNPAVKIATAGIAIGLAVMIISVSVVLGFKHTIQDKVMGFGGHITVGNFLSMHGYDQKPIVLGDSMLHVIQEIHGVEKVQPFATTQGILKTDHDFLGVQLKGVNEQFDTTFLAANIVSGTMPRLSAKTSDNSRQASQNQLLISQKQADKLHLNTGDRVFAYFINGNDVRTRRFIICGVYQTNLAAFDDILCLTDLKTVQTLNAYEEDELDGAEILLKSHELLDAMSKEFVKKVNRKADRNGETYGSETVTDMYPSIFAWLDLLDLNVWIILALMVCVAGFTMISGLLIIILERTNTIGLFKALGMRNRGIRHTFIWFAIFIIGKGLVIGNIIATAIIVLQKYTGIIQLDASVYYVSEVPLEVNFPLFILINMSTLIICSLIMTLPSMLVSHISPAKVMRYE